MSKINKLYVVETDDGIEMTFTNEKQANECKQEVLANSNDLTDDEVYVNEATKMGVYTSADGMEYTFAELEDLLSVDNDREYDNPEDSAEDIPDVLYVIDSPDGIEGVFEDEDEAIAYKDDLDESAIEDELEEMGYDPDEDNESAYAGAAFNAGYNGNVHLFKVVEAGTEYVSESGNKYSFGDLLALINSDDDEDDEEDDEDEIDSSYSSYGSYDCYDGEDYDDDDYEDGEDCE